MNRNRNISRTRGAANMIEALIDELGDRLDDSVVDELEEMLEFDLKPGGRPHLRFSKSLLDQELWVLGELSDVATELAASMRQRGEPEDDEELVKLELSRRQMAKHAAWVLSEKARVLEARTKRVLKPVALKKPTVSEDPNTIH